MQKGPFADIFVIGAGPVGLLLANLLGKQGLNVIVYDRKSKISENSRAIGITPPSLEILDRLGLASDFVRAGLKIQRVIVHGSKKTLGNVSFAGIPSRFPCILSLPQYATEQLLYENIRKMPNVRVLWEHACTNVINGTQSVQAVIMPPRSSVPIRVRAPYLCACDGFLSTVRSLSKISFRGHACRDTFLMGDFADKSDFGDEAHLFFTARGSVESFPLPEKKRRWIIQTDTLMEHAPEGFLEKNVRERARISLDPEDKTWQSAFRVNKFIMDRFWQGRIIFAGDAAHTISPIGGQGMNTGFADAAMAAQLLHRLIYSGQYERGLFIKYQRCRKKAARAAARRAWLSMRVGTLQGAMLSGLRNGIIRVLLSSPLARRLPGHFAMLTIPGQPAQNSAADSGTGSQSG